ncbi:MAG TPA: hypothetical protein VF006_23360 [Longimicrobium sp.]
MKRIGGISWGSGSAAARVDCAGSPHSLCILLRRIAYRKVPEDLSQARVDLPLCPLSDPANRLRLGRFQPRLELHGVRLQERMNSLLRPLSDPANRLHLGG